MAAVAELDPVFLKALKFLQSRTRESTNQLKRMLLEVLANKKVKTELKVNPVADFKGQPCKFVSVIER